jgi:hypothetical protein
MALSEYLRCTWCLLWGHRIIRGASKDLGSGREMVMVWCDRCGEFYGLHVLAERLPDHIKRREGGYVTLGPLRILVEYLDCQLFGHDEEWQPFYYALGARTRCRRCGAYRLTREEQ